MSAVAIITIDGPSGSGKGTISRRVAAELGWHLLDSGALYRLTGLAGTRAGIAAEDEPGHARIAAAMDVRFGETAGAESRVLLDGADVTAAIRTEAAGERASRVASYPAVRAALLDRQHRFAEAPGLVADGRDMGSVVFPAADLKVFLTATAAERAVRRFRQLTAAGARSSLEAVAVEIAARDARDSNRAASPLKAPPGAIVLDSTGVSPDTVVEHVLGLARARGLAR